MNKPKNQPDMMDVVCEKYPRKKFVMINDKFFGIPTPTIEEAKKEWEELGYELRIKEEYPHMIYLVNDDDDPKWILTIKINTQSKTYWKLWGDNSFENFTLQEHQLLTKTFRALGWEV